MLALRLRCLGLLAATWLLVAGAPHAQVTTTTTYQYDSETLLPKVVEVVASDGARRRTETTYAHEVHPGMEARNQLSQVSRTVVREQAGSPNLACSRTEWSPQAVAGGAWLPLNSRQGCASEEVVAARYHDYTARGQVTRMSDGWGASTSLVYSHDGQRLLGTVSPEGHEEWYGAAPATPLIEDFGQYAGVAGLTSAWSLSGTWALSDSSITASASGALYLWHSQPIEQSAVVIDARVQVPSGATSNWGAVRFRQTGANHGYGTSGYMVYLRRDGVMTLYKAGGGTMASASVGASDDWRRLRIVADGSLIQVWLDGDLEIQTTDSTWNGDYLGLGTSGVAASFADVRAYPAGFVAASAGYDDLGRVSRMVGPAGAVSSFEYDGLGRLTETRNNAGDLVAQNGYEYSDDGTGAYDPSRPNRITTVIHGSAVQASTVWMDGLGRSIGTTAFESLGSASSSSDDISMVQYDTAGRPSRQWRPHRAGRSSLSPATNWDGGVYQQPTAYASASQSYWGSSSKYAISATEAQFAYTETTYEASPLGRPTFVREPGAAGHGVTYRYGVGSAAPGAPAMAYTETEDSDGRTARVYTDGLGRQRFTVAGVGAPEQATTEMIYDATDRLTEVRHPLYFSPRAGESGTPHRTVYTYDTRGQVQSVQTPDAGITRMAYDRAGHLRLHQNADQATRSEATYYQYDAQGRLELESLGTLRCTIAQVNPETNACPGGSMFLEGGVGEHIRRNMYGDPRENAWNETTRPYNGWPWFIESSFEFSNTAGRLSLEAYQSEGQWHATGYAYDAEGRVSRRSTRTAAVGQPHASFAYTYDRAGQLTERVVEVGARALRQKYSYNSDGGVYRTFVGSGAAGTTVSAPLESWMRYDAAGTLDYQFFYGLPSSPWGTAFHYRHADVTGRLRYLQHPTYSGAPFREELSYTPGGLISQMISQGPSTGTHAGSGIHPERSARSWSYSFDYDDLGRLLYAHSGGVSTGAYSVGGLQYDANGNVLSLSRRMPSGRAGAQVVDQLAYSYAIGTNRLSNVVDAVAATSEGWDAEDSEFLYRSNGLVRKHTTHPPIPYGSENRTVVRYDTRGLPTYETFSVWNDDYIDFATETLYTRYDGSGQRIWRQYRDYEYNMTTTRYVVDGGSVVGEFDGNGTLRHWNTATGRIDAAGQRFVYHRDHLGTPRVVQQVGSGTVTEARDYYPFGLEMPGRTFVSGTPTREGFTGHELDAETGLNYAGARYYMPALGRWTSVDPLAGEFPSHSPYNYALNNPLSLVDPDGQAPTCEPPGSCPAWIGPVLRAGPRIYRAVRPYARRAVTAARPHLERAAARTRQFADDAATVVRRPFARRAARRELREHGVNARNAQRMEDVATQAGRADDHYAAVREVAESAMSRPGGGSSEFNRRVVDQLFKASDGLPGGTAGAARYELATGLRIGDTAGRNALPHVGKARQAISQLERILRTGNIDRAGRHAATQRDLGIARSLLDDLARAVGN